MGRNWFVQHRQDWIADMLNVYGFINRQHLMLKFGVSQPQASTDLTTFLRDNPEHMEYDLSRKCYVRSLADALAPAEPGKAQEP